MEKTVRYHDRIINYQITGKGNAIVLLHGFLEDLHIWDSFAQELSRRDQILTIDLPGFGKSAIIEPIHAMELMADVVKHVLDTEQIESCVMVGHSMGGYVGAAFAEKYPEYLSGLVFFHSHAAADSEEEKVNRQKTIELIKKDALKFIVSFIPLLFAESNMKIYNEKITRLQQTASVLSAETVVAALAGMRDRHDHRELLAKLDFPVLFIIGKQDSRITMENILPQLQIPQHSEVLIMENVGHMGFIEAEDKTRELIKGFAHRVMNE